MHPGSVLPQWTASAIYVGSQLDLSPLHFKLQWDTVPTPARCEQGTNPRLYCVPPTLAIGRLIRICIPMDWDKHLQMVGGR